MPDGQVHKCARHAIQRQAVNILKSMIRDGTAEACEVSSLLLNADIC